MLARTTLSADPTRHPRPLLSGRLHGPAARQRHCLLLADRVPPAAADALSATDGQLLPGRHGAESGNRRLLPARYDARSSDGLMRKVALPATARADPGQTGPVLPARQHAAAQWPVLQGRSPGV